VVCFFFYPADFTFVCPTELEDLQNEYATLKGMGVEVYGVSTDTHFSHKAWADTSPAIGTIQYYLVGDQNHDLTKQFGNLREGVGLADRGTFVTDPEGVVQLVEVTPRAWAATLPSWCARSRPPSTGRSTPARCAPPSGKKVRKRWLRRSIWSARSKFLKLIKGQCGGLSPRSRYSRREGRLCGAAAPDLTAGGMHIAHQGVRNATTPHSFPSRRKTFRGAV
jgi:peroxiredoxin (alkyl hydroperoxide reductase subunit C)